MNLAELAIARDEVLEELKTANRNRNLRGYESPRHSTHTIIELQRMYEGLCRAVRRKALELAESEGYAA